MVKRYNPAIHHRHSIRLKGHDYAQAGAYYVTICSWNREHVFGGIANSEMKLSPIGEIIYQEWYNISVRFLNVELDAFIIMPNHLHGTIIVGAPLVGALNKDRAGASPAPTVGYIIGSFKSLCIYNCKNNGLIPGNLWQRNYFERVIRNENELFRIREYIRNNPFHWADDEYNPDILKHFI